MKFDQSVSESKWMHDSEVFQSVFIMYLVSLGFFFILPEEKYILDEEYHKNNLFLHWAALSMGPDDYVLRLFLSIRNVHKPLINIAQA